MIALPPELLQDRVVAVLRAKSMAAPREIGAALVRAGVRCIELTYTIANVLPHIAAVAQIPGAVVGAGTVLSAQQARDAIAAGARFLVTPAVRPEVATVAKAAGVPVIMGAFTPTEVAAAIDLAPAAIKIFPSDVGGPAYLKSLRGPFDKVQFMPSGGVTAQNAKDWLKAGAVAVSAGSSLASTDSLIAGDHARIAAAAAEFVNALK